MDFNLPELLGPTKEMEGNFLDRFPSLTITFIPWPTSHFEGGCIEEILQCFQTTLLHFWSELRATNSILDFDFLSHFPDNLSK